MNPPHSAKIYFKHTDELIKVITFLENNIGILGKDYDVYYNKYHPIKPYSETYEKTYEKIEDMGTVLKLVELVGVFVPVTFAFKNECDLCLFNLAYTL